MTMCNSVSIEKGYICHKQQINLLLKNEFKNVTYLLISLIQERIYLKYNHGRH